MSKRGLAACSLFSFLFILYCFFRPGYHQGVGTKEAVEQSSLVVLDDAEDRIGQFEALTNSG